MSSITEVFEFDDVWKAGYEQAVIEDTKKLELALHVVSFLVKENRRLVGQLDSCENCLVCKGDDDE